MVYWLWPNATEMQTYAEIVRKKLWCGGQQGLVVLGVGLRWAWWAAQSSEHQGTESDWVKLVELVTSILKKVVAKARWVFYLLVANFFNRSLPSAQKVSGNKHIKTPATKPKASVPASKSATRGKPAAIQEESLSAGSSKRPASAHSDQPKKKKLKVTWCPTPIHMYIFWCNAIRSCLLCQNGRVYLNHRSGFMIIYYIDRLPHWCPALNMFI